MVKTIKNNLVLIAILLLALFLRSFRLDYLELFGDELDAGYQAYSLMTTGHDYMGNLMPSYIHSFFEWRAPGLMYAIIPFIKIFGLNEWGVRMGPAVFGVLSIWGFYVLLLTVGIKKKVALTTAFLLSITPWHIQYSRAGFEITLLSCLLIFGLYFLIKKKICIASIFLSFSLYTYSSANILMPLFVVMTLYFYKINLKDFVKLVVVGLILSLPLAYQLLFGHVGDRFDTMNILSNKDVIALVNDYQNASGNTLVSKIFYNKYVVSIKKIAFNYSNAFGSNFLFKDGDVTFRHSLHQVGNMFWFELPLIFAGLVVSIKHKKYLWVLGLLLVSPIASSLTIDGFNHATRLFMLVFPLSFLAALGFHSIYNFKFLFIVFFVYEFCQFQFYYWNFYRDESWRWWHTGYKQSMQYILDNKDKYQKVVMDNTYEPSLIRFLFWNKVDSRLLANFNYNDDIDVDGFRGFCFDNKYCFVNFSNKFVFDNLKSNTLYLIAQERSVGGDWDWRLDPPSGIHVVKTVTNYYSEPVLYLVNTSEK